VTAFQRDYWDQPATRVVFGVDLRGPLDRGALEAAVRELARLHPILRTTYAERDGAVHQVISDEPRAPIETIACSPLRLTTIGELIEGTFDLVRGPCWRLLVLSDGSDPAHHVLVFDMHHIGWDALSSPIALAHLGRLYAGQAVPAESVRYIDLARELDEYARTPAGAADHAYWRELLAGAPPTQLPFDGGAGSGPSRMRAARGMAPAPSFARTLAALAQLLHDTTGQRDVCIEIPIAQRRHDPRLAEALGPFVHNILVRSRGADQPRLDEALQHARARATDAAPPGTRRVAINYLKAQPLGFGHRVDFGPALRAMGFSPALATTSHYDLFVYIRGDSVAVFANEAACAQATCDRLLASYLALL